MSENNKETAVEQVIRLLEEEPEAWFQNPYTLGYRGGKIEIWTVGLPYLSIGISAPERKIGIIDKIRLQRAVNNWHKTAIIVI